MHVDHTNINPRDVYSRRFVPDAELRREMWKVLTGKYFQRFVPEDASLVEIAAGHCEFINEIRAARKVAVDINEDTRTYAAPEVEVILTPSTDLSPLPDGKTDVIFISNFLEHISKPDITQTLRECRRILRPGGTIMILQPSIRYRPGEYWMFFDHVTPLDDRSLCEILEVLDYRIDFCLPRFLPHSTKDRSPRLLWNLGNAIGLPLFQWTIQAYLALPLLYKIFGYHAFVVASKPVE